MSKRYYIKAAHGSRSSNDLHNVLRYAFISVNSVVAVLFVLLFNPMNMFGSYISPVSEEAGQVQGTYEAYTPEVVPTTPVGTPNPTIAPEPTNPPTPTPTPLKKKSYRIAVFGDSMVDTMGELLEYLDHALKKRYPNATFGLYNYGVGAQNIEEGFARFHKDFSYQTRNYPPISKIQADVIIIGSFAYNPFSPHDRDKHWLTLTHLVQEAQRTGAKVYMLAEIAPLRRDFGKGPGGVNWSDDTAYIHSGRIIEQLENVVGLSWALRVPIINVYEATLVGSAKAGNKKYVNPHDGIHPSVEGHEYTAEVIVDTVKLD